MICVGERNGIAAGRNPVAFGHCRFKSYSAHSVT